MIPKTSKSPNLEMERACQSVGNRLFTYTPANSPIDVKSVKTTGAGVGVGLGVLVAVAVGGEIGTFVGNTGKGTGRVGIAVDVCNGVTVFVGTGAIVAVGVGVTVGNAVALGAGMSVAIGNGEVVWVEAGIEAATDVWIAAGPDLTPTANTENPGVSAR